MLRLKLNHVSKRGTDDAMKTGTNNNGNDPALQEYIRCISIVFSGLNQTSL